AAQPDGRPGPPAPADLPGGPPAVAGGSGQSRQGDDAGAAREDERADPIHPDPGTTAEVRADEEGAPGPRALEPRQGEVHHDPQQPVELVGLVPWAPCGRRPSS